MVELKKIRRYADTLGFLALIPLILIAFIGQILSGTATSFLSVESILQVSMAMFGMLMMALPAQVLVKQAYLSRLVWIGASAYAVWAMWVMFPFYEEAVPHDIFMDSHLGDEFARYSPAVATPDWLPVAMWTYYVLSALFVANLVAAIVFTVRQAVIESRAGVADIAEESELERLGKLANVQSSLRDKNPSSASKPQERSDLTTRDTEALEPTTTFADLSGQEELKNKLLDAVDKWKAGGKMNGKNGILLYGVPGTGKTAFAEALAGEIRLKYMKVDVGSMASRWVNQTTEQLQHIIDSALRQAPCVLFFDEVEAILPDRSRIERGDSEEAKVVASFLSSIEKLRAGRVLLIAATNYKDRVDGAANREGRFDFHIEVTVPDFEARKGLILRALDKAGKSAEPAVLDRLARRWAGFNVKRIQLAVERAAGFAATKVVGMADFMRGLRYVQGNASSVPETALGLDDLYFDDDLKDRLSKLAAVFARSDEIEGRGGSVPKGVIFYGPPGTGKTTMAQALAKASGWAFIATSGKEILADANKLAEICRKASDLRPAIVFIDEADDILGNRRMSGMKAHTNDLLRTIDGAGEPMHDVAWILATNDVDGLDEAVIRRFPAKIELPIPGVGTTMKLVRAWAARRPEMIPGGVDAWSAEVAVALEGLAPSVVNGILESALSTEAANSVICGEAMSITLEDVLAARREMRA